MSQKTRIKSYLGRFLKKVSPFKGQKGQDKWVLFTVLPFKRNGFFLDLAAADGVTHSNTFVLEKIFGWNGICVEPNPEFLSTLKKNRNCIIDGSVVSNKREKVSFRIDNGQLGGIVAEDTDNSNSIRGEQLSNANIVIYNSVLLNDLLDKYKAPNIIDYFSLDIEGSEERVIGSLDFNKYQFRCLTVERPTPKVNNILFKNGYEFVKNYKCDSFYAKPGLVDMSKIDLQPFEQVPAKDW